MIDREITFRLRVGGWGEHGAVSTACRWFCTIGGRLETSDAGLVESHKEGVWIWYAWAPMTRNGSPGSADGGFLRCIGDGERPDEASARAAAEGALQAFCEEEFGRSVPKTIAASLTEAQVAVALAVQTWRETAPNLRVPPGYEGTFKELWAPLTERLEKASAALTVAVKTSGALFEKATRRARGNGWSEEAIHGAIRGVPGDDGATPTPVFGGI